MQLNLSKANIALKKDGQQTYIRCLVRKKWLVFTPEEYVRQHVLHWLVQEKQVPLSYIAVERQITVNKLKKRFDILVFNKAHEPILIVECKAPDIVLNTDVVLQITNYNNAFAANLLMVTNGLQHYFFAFSNKQYFTIKNLADFGQW